MPRDRERERERERERDTNLFQFQVYDRQASILQCQHQLVASDASDYQRSTESWGYTTYIHVYTKCHLCGNMFSMHDVRELGAEVSTLSLPGSYLAS